jgi:hypothetical protein
MVHRTEASLLIAVVVVRFMMETLGKKLDIDRKLQMALKLRISQRRLDLSQVA